VQSSGVPVCVDGNGQLGECGPSSPVSQLKSMTEKQAAKIASQENQIQTLTAALKQQADQLQKVSAQLEMIRPTPRVVENR
jgi:septal ring factor EnvC (AmiA/AmiB activator)